MPDQTLNTIGKTLVQWSDRPGRLRNVLSQEAQKRHQHRILLSSALTLNGVLRDDQHTSRRNDVAANIPGEFRVALEQGFVEAKPERVPGSRLFPVVAT